MSKPFDKSSVAAYVRERSLYHPSSWLPAIGGAGLGLVGFVAGTGPLALAALGAGLVGSSFGLAYQFVVRGSKYRRDYFEIEMKKLAVQREQRLRTLEYDLERLQVVEGASDFAAQAKRQIRIAIDKYHNFGSLLADRLNRRELTYARYAGAVEQLFLGVMNNVHMTAEVLRALRGYDMEHINRRLGELGRVQFTSPADQQELAALKQRLILHDRQVYRVSELLTQNEIALTKIDQAAAAIASLRLGSNNQQAEMEMMLAQLEELIARTEAYQPQSRPQLGHEPAVEPAVVEATAADEPAVQVQRQAPRA